MARRASRVACTVEQVVRASTKCSGRYEIGLLVHRRLAIPLSAIALFAIALTAPAGATLLLMPATSVFVVAALGITAMTFLIDPANVRSLA